MLTLYVIWLLACAARMPHQWSRTSSIGARPQEKSASATRMAGIKAAKHPVPATCALVGFPKTCYVTAVDFERVLTLIAEFFARQKRPFAVIGAFALQAYGYTRATRDLDFVVEASCQDELIMHLASLGYETLHRSSGYSNHIQSDPAMGRVDFVYVDGETAALIFRSPQQYLRLGSMMVPVPKPEHLIAMKLHGIRNDPSRTFRDLADIQELMRLPQIDPEQVRGYFERYGLSDRYDELKRMS